MGIYASSQAGFAYCAEFLIAAWVVLFGLSSFRLACGKWSFNGGCSVLGPQSASFKEHGKVPELNLPIHLSRIYHAALKRSVLSHSLYRSAAKVHAG